MVYCVSDREERAVVARRGIRCVVVGNGDDKDVEVDIATRSMS